MTKFLADPRSFSELREAGAYYVDKTPVIRELMEDDRMVLMMTRPPKFGQTLFMDTLRTFLDVNPERPGDRSRQEKLFAGLKITEDAAFCEKYMGQVPVVLVSFEDVMGLDYETARHKMADCLFRLSQNFAYLRTSPKLDGFSRRRLEQCFSERTLAEDNVALVNTLEVLVNSVSEHYDREVVLIIDDYDVPLASAAQGGYYKEMAGFLESMFGVVLKPGLGARNSLCKAFLTGTHRFSEESFNNCCINGLLSDWPMLNQAFGLTEEETAAVLRAAGLTARADNVRQWYGGFRCGSCDLYRPADVMRLAFEAQSGNVPPAGDLPNYFSREALPSAVARKLSTIGWEDQEAMTALANDQPAWVHLEDSVYGNDLATKYGASLWTLLVQTGLLSVAARREGRVWRFEYEVRFSNRAAKAVLDDCLVNPWRRAQEEL